MYCKGKAVVIVLLRVTLSYSLPGVTITVCLRHYQVKTT